MRLGTFWGLTAPMLLLAYPDTDALLDNIKFMQSAANGDIITNLHSELYFLLQSSNLQEVEVSPPDGGFFSDREPDVLISNGTISNAQDPEEVAKSEIRNEIVLKLAQKIVAGEQKRKFIDCHGDLMEFLDSSALDLINNSEFYSSEINREVAKYYRSIVSETGVSVLNDIKHYFACSTKLPEKIVRNGVPIELSSDLVKVYQYFQNRMEDVQLLFNKTIATTSAEIKVFNLELSRFVQRRPNFLEYITVTYFDFAIKSKSANILLQTIDDYKFNLDILINAINTSIVATEEQEEIADVDYDAYEVSPYLPHMEDYNEEELQHINDLYVHAISLTPENIAARLEVSPDTIDELYEASCNVGICGLNGQTNALFMDALNNIVMSDAFVCRKSQAYLDELLVSVDKAKHLLRNIKPLGAEI